MDQKEDHAYQNAAGWAASIAELVAALDCDYDRLEALRDERADLAFAAINYASQEIVASIDALARWDAEYGEELAELTAAATIDGEVCKDAEAARERISESPLSVEVRSDWTAVGDALCASEFNILLSTGGPALRIRGELNNGEPDRAWLEYQDWGTPWTEYHGDGCEQETLLTFCRQFYFGE